MAGLTFLRRAWINTDHVRAAAFVLAGVITPSPEISARWTEIFVAISSQAA
jgi:hypothetical protein